MWKQKKPERRQEKEQARQSRGGQTEGKKIHHKWDNCQYVFHRLGQEEGARAFAFCGGDLVFGVLLPFLEAALAGAVAACLVSGRAPGEILLLVAGYVLLLQTARFLQGHLRAIRDKVLFLFRVDIMFEFNRKTLEMDGQSLETAKGREMWEAAKRNVYNGNHFGIEAYAKNCWNMLLNLCGLVAYGVIVGRESIFLLLLLVSQTLLVTGFHGVAEKRALQAEDEAEGKWSGFQYLRRESIVPQNGKDIRMYGMDKWFLKTFHQIIERSVELLDWQEKGYTAAGIANHLLSFARNVVVYGWLLGRMAAGRLTLPAFLLYLGIIAGFENWVRGFLEAVINLAKNEKIIESYRKFMEYGMVDEGKPAPKHPGKLHEIRLEHVCFRYEGSMECPEKGHMECPEKGHSREDTIHDLNLTIRAGEKLALVGPNGAGKTTLIKLLCGLYRPTSGKIYLDGQELQDLSQREVFQEFAVVFQDVFTFAFPVAENVSCVKAGAEDGSRLRKSLEDAGLLERVQSLPKKEHTSMDKDMDPEGVTFSGGELQKLMLARALYKDSPVVILDEPTAALDPIAESEMYEKYDEMIQGKTAVFISHRLSSTRFCDRILFLEEGRIAQEGSHESLMREGGPYAELFALQARYYQKNPESVDMVSERRASD
nr:ABC transporter ATP-binding protein [uncultured Acetatifactor sp.]